jgi:LysM repeat protein
MVRRGETLGSIAAKRKGLSVADLASLNGLQVHQPLAIGQKLKLPNQTYLDAGRAARNNFLALAYYSETHDGRLPPNSAHPPSIAAQIEAQGVRTVQKNGYSFNVDALSRTKEVFGEIQLEASQRSRKAQADAGKTDRRTTDDGGHYIAARFYGPRDWFNHFAQDANFNRGAYRVLEDEWAKAVRAGQRVFVDIVPRYHGTSKRPYVLTVTWFVDVQRFFQEFPNERRGR